MKLRNDPSREEKLLLLLSRPVLHKNERAFESAVSDLLNGGINFSRFNEIAFKNGVSGYIYQKIKHYELFPEEIKNELKKEYRRTALDNMHRLGEVISVLKHLNRSRIPAMPLKGPVFSDRVFRDMGVYPSGDIDILVHPDNLFQAKKTLRDKCGYENTQEIHEEDLLAVHYHLNLMSSSYLLELHWNLVKRYFDIPADFWWSALRRHDWNGIELIELQVEKYLIHLCFRLFDHCYHPLRFFLLIGALIETRDPETDWIRLMAYARQFKMEKLMTFSLKLLHDLFDVRIPPGISDKKFRFYHVLKSVVLSGVFNGVRHKHLRMMLYAAALLDDPGKIVKVLFGRVFPSREEVRLRYSLPRNSYKTYLYLLLNPILLFFHKEV